MADRRIVIDAIFAISLFLVAIGGVYLPRLLLKKQNGNTNGSFGLIFQLGNMLSAGVMLSAGLCHLLADALPDIEKKVTSFPLGPFLTASGYLLTLVADEIAVSMSGAGHHGHNHTPFADVSQKMDVEGADGISNTGIQMQSLQPSEIDTVKLVGNHENSSFSEGNPKQAADTASTRSVSFITALLMGAALSLHSVLEGAALGAQEEEKDAEDIFIAIIAHKGLAAYALGASLMDSQTSSKRFWSVAMGFSLASPVGIFLGYIISSIAEGVVGSSLSALASGTFLYVAMMEVIPKELANPSNKVLKLTALLLGFGLMSLLAVWT